MPRFHNPLGSSLAERDKQELVRLAEAYDVYLVEDDYLGDLEENKRQIRCTHMICPHM